MTTGQSESPQTSPEQTTAPNAEPDAPTVATEARDTLLLAIAREASFVAATQPGQASAVLAELARTHRNMITAATQADVATLGIPSDGNFAAAIPRTATAPAEIPATMTEARDALLRAIAVEAENVAAEHPGQASEALAELVRAYALVTAGTHRGITITSAAIPAFWKGSERNGTDAVALKAKFDGLELTLTPQLVVGEAESDVNYRAPLRIGVRGTNFQPFDYTGQVAMIFEAVTPV